MLIPPHGTHAPSLPAQVVIRRAGRAVDPRQVAHARAVAAAARCAARASPVTPPYAGHSRGSLLRLEVCSRRAAAATRGGAIAVAFGAGGQGTHSTSPIASAHCSNRSCTQAAIEVEPDGLRELGGQAVQLPSLVPFTASL